MTGLVAFSTLESLFLEAMVVSVGFGIPFYITIRLAADSVLSHPTAKKLATAAARISGEGGDWLSILIKEGFGWLKSRGKDQGEPPKK